MKKRILSLILVIAMLIAFTPVIYAAEIIDSGTCGENVEWKFTDDGGLIISGNGDMPMLFEDLPPWYDNWHDAIKYVIIDSGVTSISYQAFADCKSLETITIPNSIQYIGDGAFLRCTALTSIEIPEGITTLGTHMFSGCTNLTSIVIPATVTIIGFGVFEDCIHLADVYYGGTKDNWTRIENTCWYSMNSYALECAKYIINANIHYNSVSSDSAVFNQETDIKISVPSDWAKSDIEKAIDLGLIPEELQTEWQTPITRLDFCKLAKQIYKVIKGQDLSIASTNDFSDLNGLSADDKFTVQSAELLGIVSGYEDGTFRPYNDITREEAAAMLMRTAKALGGSEPIDKIGTQFSDCGSCAEWAMNGIKYVYNADIMKGTDETYQSSGITDGYYTVQFSPKTTYTREQAMVTFYRLYKNFVSETDSDFVPVGGYAAALKNYEKAVEDYRDAVIEAVEQDKQKENLKKQMIASMKEHWILKDFSGKKEVPDEVYEAMYLFTCELDDIRVVSKDVNWSKLIDQIGGCVDMTVTPLSSIGHGKYKYSVNGTEIIIDAAATAGKTGFGTVSWNGNSAMFSSNPKEVLSTFQSLVIQCVDLVEDIYTDEFEAVAKDLTGYSNISEFLQKKLSSKLNRFMKEMGLGDFNELVGYMSEMLTLAENMTMIEDADDLLTQMQKLSKKDLLSDTSVTDIMVKEALVNLKKAETKLISEAEKRIYE